MPRAKPEVPLVSISLRLHPDTVGALDRLREGLRDSRSAYVAHLIAAEAAWLDGRSGTAPKPLKAPVAREKRPSRRIVEAQLAPIPAGRMIGVETFVQLGPVPVLPGSRLRGKD